MTRGRLSIPAILVGLMLCAVPLVGCSSSNDTSTVSPTSGNHFESDDPNDSIFTDDAGTEMVVGDDLDLPNEWPSGVPVPSGRLVAVAIADPATAVATWQIDADLSVAESDYISQLELSGFEISPAPDLSTESITVYFAIGQKLDITVSATPGEKPSDPGEITVVINPSL